ncbi:hypothetical protein, partial [Streptomyces sp. NPDC059874]|uniref:hypothetical protein n=1 Tax=Streptomyces sp. NPDC059874 TaxID=3346983 RepID=UPI00366926C5
LKSLQRGLGGVLRAMQHCDAGRGFGGRGELLDREPGVRLAGAGFLLGVRGSSPGRCSIAMPAAALVAAVSFWIVNLAFV